MDERTNERKDGRMGQWDSITHNAFADTVGSKGIKKCNNELEQ